MNMINLEEWKLNDANLLQSIGILSRINGNPEILRTVVTARIGYVLFSDFYYLYKSSDLVLISKYVNVLP